MAEAGPDRGAPDETGAFDASSRLPANVRNRYQSWSEFARGETRPQSMPSELQFALNNRCNFECVYCSDQRPGNTVPRSEIAGPAFEDVLRSIPGAELLAFHGISEFFIDKRFFDLVQRCADAGAGLSLNTNASVATPRHLEVLASYPGRLQINFSLDAATPETFRRVRGWDFERVLANVRAYVKRLKRRRAPTWTTASFVIMKSNVHEVVRFVRLARRLGTTSAILYRLHEYGSLDWSVRAADGSTFDYRGERTDRFMREYNAAIRAATAVARKLRFPLEIPALYPAHEVRTAARAERTTAA